MRDDQRKAMFAKARQIAIRQGIVTKPIKVTDEGHYIRLRMKEPEKFRAQTFRTLDVGKVGYTKFIMAKPKNSEKLQVQSVILNKKDYNLEPKNPLPELIREARETAEKRRRKELGY
jgi:hypothetical protein